MHIEMLSFRAYAAEIIRPWKVFTFAVGMLFLFWGALNLRIADWDVGVSIVMGSLTYLCSPWCVRAILYSVLQKPRFWFLWIAASLLLAWFVIDGSYVLYHTAVGNPMLRWDNMVISMPSYFILGFLWLYAGPLREIMSNVLSIAKGTA